MLFSQAQAEITQFVLNDAQKGKMAQAQQKAKKYQEKGQMDEVMKIIQGVQESIEDSLTHTQKCQIKATLAVRMRGIYASWMETSINADVATLRNQEIQKRMSKEDKAKLEEMQAAVQKVSEAEQQAMLQSIIAFAENALSASETADLEAFIAGKTADIEKKRLAEFKEHQMVQIRQGATSEQLYPDQKKAALTLQSACNIAQQNEDEQGFLQAANNLSTFMEGALNEQQKAKAAAEVAKAEAVLDKHILEHVNQKKEAAPSTTADVKESTQTYMSNLAAKISSGGEERLEALDEMKAMLKMLDELKSKYEPVVQEGEKLVAADAESQCD